MVKTVDENFSARFAIDSSIKILTKKSTSKQMKTWSLDFDAITVGKQFNTCWKNTAENLCRYYENEMLQVVPTNVNVSAKLIKYQMIISMSKIKISSRLNSLWIFQIKCEWKISPGSASISWKMEANYGLHSRGQPVINLSKNLIKEWMKI